ncbi:hypothetical protein [Anaerophaga thermohalophila]|jgi:hypothetical protein|uniref:hypothetical protein n=1 Tax=Anaerophaga thermohalophila TaxID=177400 RepID=UPI0005C76A8F|nr:hypothetical protein [Anaerophaga thermohalophila]
MKSVKGSRFSGIMGFMVISILTVVVLFKYEKPIFFSFGIFLIVCGLYLISILPWHNYFIYTENELFVKNNWNPFFYRHLSILEIEDIVIRNEAYMGLVVKITLKNGKKYLFHTGASRQSLEEMITDIMHLRND